MPKAKTILVTHAAFESGEIPEEDYRLLIEKLGEYSNWETVKRIKVEHFEAIKELLVQEARKAQENNAIQAQEASLSPQEKTELVTKDLEEIDISPNQPLTEKERLKLQIGSDLPGQVVRLNQISKILAVAAADEGVKDFEEIYTHRLTTGINRITSNQMAKACKAIDDLQKSDNGDFLQTVGKNRNLQSSDLDAGMDLLLGKIK